MTTRYLRYNKETEQVEEFEKPSVVKRLARWPLVCDASGVSPSQVDEVREDIQAHGFTGVDVNEEGQMVYSSPGQRKKYLHHIGMYDRNASYGDPMPKNR